MQDEKACSDLTQKLKSQRKDSDAEKPGVINAFSIIKQPPSDELDKLMPEAKPTSSAPMIAANQVKINMLTINHYNANNLVLITPQQINNTVECQKKSKRIFQCPIQNPDFIERKDLQDKIYTFFSNSNNKMNTIVLTACGIGGVGKTQLAQYLYFLDKYKYGARIWFYADDINTLLQNYLQLAEEFNIPVNENYSTEKKVSQVKSWLEMQSETFLIVYDNADNPDSIAKYLPQLACHHILITSRNKHWSFFTIDVDVMQDYEALDLIKRILGSKRNDLETDLKSLVIDNLGNLPLAIAQAGAYIKRSEISISEYLRLYAKSKFSLLSVTEEAKVHDEYRKQLSAKGLPIGAKHEPVWITFNLNFEILQKHNLLAIELLFLCAYLQSDKIPYFLLIELVSNGDLTTAELSKNDCIDALLEYSFIRADNKLQMISIHRLLQAIIQYKIEQPNDIVDNNQKNVTHYILKLMMRIQQAHIKNCVNVENVRALLPHFEIILRHITSKIDSNKYLPSIADFYDDYGSALREVGNFELSEIIYEKALSLREKILPLNELAIAKTRASLGVIYRDLKKLDKALAIQKMAKHTLQQVNFGANRELGLTLLNIGTTYRNKGYMYKDLTKNMMFKKANKYYDRSHEVLLKFHGETTSHHDIGDVLRNLGCLNRDLKDVQKAMSYFEKAKIMLVNYYGDKHPKIAKFKANMAECYILLKNMTAARMLLQEGLDAQLIAYGDKHVETAKSWMYFGMTYVDENPLLAKEYLMKALAIFEKNYSPDYKYVVETKALLNSLHREQVPNSIQLPK